MGAGAKAGRSARWIRLARCVCSGGALPVTRHPPPPRPALGTQIHFFLLMSRQGKVRLAKWYNTFRCGGAGPVHLQQCGARRGGTRAHPLTPSPHPPPNSTNPRPRARRSQKERARIVKETTPLVLQRPLKLCNFVDWKSFKLVGRHRPMGAWQAGVCAW